MTKIQESKNKEEAIKMLKENKDKIKQEAESLSREFLQKTDKLKTDINKL